MKWPELGKQNNLKKINKRELTNTTGPFKWNI